MKSIHKWLLVVCVTTLTGCGGDSGSGGGLSTNEAYKRFSEIYCPLRLGDLIDMYGQPYSSQNYGYYFFYAWGKGGSKKAYENGNGWVVQYTGHSNPNYDPHATRVDRSKHVVILKSEKHNGVARHGLDIRRKFDCMLGAGL